MSDDEALKKIDELLGPWPMPKQNYIIVSPTMERLLNLRNEKIKMDFKIHSLIQKTKKGKWK